MIFAKYKNIFRVGILMSVFLLSAVPIHAQSILPLEATEGIIENFEGTTGTKIDQERTSKNILNIAVKIINWALTLISIVFVAFLVYAGFRYMTAGAEAAPREDAVRTIKSAVIGLAIVLASFAITRFVIGTLIKPPSTTPYPDRVARDIETLLNRKPGQ